MLQAKRLGQVENLLIQRITSECPGSSPSDFNQPQICYVDESWDSIQLCKIQAFEIGMAQFCLCFNDVMRAEVATMVCTAAEEQKAEALVELPLELCRIMVKGLSCSLWNGVSLLPSFMHRLEGSLLAIQLRRNLPRSHLDIPADLVIPFLILLLF